MSDPSSNKLGKYQIIREIARSNDIVYEAVDPEINRRLALKELYMAPNLDGAARQERIERFWREGRSAGRLTHPNIVTIYDVGKDGDRYYIAMEYLEGQTLRDVLKSRGALSVKETVDYACQLCSALSYAHQNGVIHRDIKPENIQFMPGNYVKITDFGIARLVGEPSITQNGQVFGTPSYMSPEQVAGGEVDVRSDIFSLGIVLYEMISGQKPFTGDTVVTITYNIMHSPVPDPPGAPPFIVNAVRKATAKEKQDRYASADLMAEDLRNENAGSAFMTGQTATNPFGIPTAPTYTAQPPGYQPSQPTYQPSTPGTTPYGTGAPPPLQQQGQAPNPFSADPNAPAPPPAWSPPKPIFSAETRNFLGVFLLILALAGMLVFAIWALSRAYTSYQVSTTSAAASRYYDQGMKLYEKGQLEAAMGQWQNAINASPKSQAGKKANDAIFQALVAQCQLYEKKGAQSSISGLAQNLIGRKPKSPEGYYYGGIASQALGNAAQAAWYYQMAEEYGGNDQYAQAARARREQLPQQIVPEAPQSLFPESSQSNSTPSSGQSQPPPAPAPQQDIPGLNPNIPHQPDPGQ